MADLDNCIEDKAMSFNDSKRELADIKSVMADWEERFIRKMRSLFAEFEQKMDQRVVAVLPAVVDEVVIPRVNNAVETRVREVVAVENVSFEQKMEQRVVAVLPAVVDEVVIPRVNNAVETKVREVPAVENVTEVYLGLRAPNPKLGGWTEYGQMMLVCCATLMRRRAAGLEPTGVGGI